MVARAAFAAGATDADDPEQFAGGGVVEAGVDAVPPPHATREAAKTSPATSWKQVLHAPRCDPTRDAPEVLIFCSSTQSSFLHPISRDGCIERTSPQSSGNPSQHKKFRRKKNDLIGLVPHGAMRNHVIADCG